MVDDLNARPRPAEEVAQRTGTTIRTIRWYQSEGLCPAPPLRADGVFMTTTTSHA
jgi:hypothetical protein